MSESLIQQLIGCRDGAMVLRWLGMIPLGTISMRRKRIPYVEIWRDRHKRLRVYFRKDRGDRIPLP